MRTSGVTRLIRRVHSFLAMSEEKALSSSLRFKSLTHLLRPGPRIIVCVVSFVVFLSGSCAGFRVDVTTVFGCCPV